MEILPILPFFQFPFFRSFLPHYQGRILIDFACQIFREQPDLQFHCPTKCEFILKQGVCDRIILSCLIRCIEHFPPMIFEIPTAVRLVEGWKVGRLEGWKVGKVDRYALSFAANLKSGRMEERQVPIFRPSSLLVFLFFEF